MVVFCFPTRLKRELMERQDSQFQPIFYPHIPSLAMSAIARPDEMMLFIVVEKPQSLRVGWTLAGMTGFLKFITLPFLEQRR